MQNCMVLLLTPVNGKLAGTLFSTPSESVTYLSGVSTSKVSLRSLPDDFFKVLISIYYPDFLFL